MKVKVQLPECGEFYLDELPNITYNEITDSWEPIHIEYEINIGDGFAAPRELWNTIVGKRISIIEFGPKGIWRNIWSIEVGEVLECGISGIIGCGGTNDPTPPAPIYHPMATIRYIGIKFIPSDIRYIEHGADRDTEEYQRYLARLWANFEWPLSLT